MRKGVLTADLSLGDGSTLKIASQMYADGNTKYRGHIEGFSQTRKMSDALSGRTSMSVANMAVHNEHEGYDDVLFSGSADIRIGNGTDPVVGTDPIILDATINVISRTDNRLSIAVIDGQSRGNTKQQRIFDTSGEGFGTLLPEPWGRVYRLEMVGLDGDTGLVYGCAGPIASISAVFVGDIYQSSGYTTSIIGSTVTVTFTTQPEGTVTIDSFGIGSTLPGGMLRKLLTRTTTVCQGVIAAWSTNTMILDERVDSVTETLVGKTVTKMTPTNGQGSRTITAYDSATRMVTLSSTWATNPVPGVDLYSIVVNTQAGGFRWSQTESAGFDTLDAELPYAFGLAATGGINAISMQDKLLGPLLCHMGPMRDGMVRLSRLRPAALPSQGDITRIIDEVDRMPLHVYWHVEARYRRNRNEDQYRSVSAFDAKIKALYPEATTLTIDVPVSTDAGALAAAEHWLTCFGEPTEIATMSVDHDLTKFNLNDVVNIIDDRYQFKGGKLAVVVSMTDNFNEHDQLGVWVKS